MDERPRVAGRRWLWTLARCCVKNRGLGAFEERR
jgi:hypothetical protein